MPWWQGTTDHEIVLLIGSKICCDCLVIFHFATLLSCVVCLWLDVSCVVSRSCAVSIIGVLFVVSAPY